MTNYEEYAALALKKKELEAEMDEIKGRIMDQMLAEGVNKMNTVHGTISVAKRKLWEWPEAILQEEAEFKLRKKKLQPNIPYSESPYLMFRVAEVEEKEVEHGKIH
ncbi:hypothetical protein LCGC14_0417810 [marine sediment metagenome]|uniref:Uncharacterized protein n=1 Tax=marine sediment metagenome TaxID=412755 RepID=A0A0F9SRU6_9ZZZZ